jgi:hypothetical protein
MAQNGALSAKQRRAIASLAAGGSVVDAAAAAGVSDRTVHRWHHEPAFAAALRKARALALSGVFNALIARGRRAVEILELAMEGDASNSQRLAADAVIQNIIKLHDVLDLEARVSELENAINEQES